MPNIPIPQQVPIQRAGWSTDFSGNVQMPNNERTPINPIMSGLSQAGMQAQQALQGAQTANAVTDVQQKQRKMQLSMLNGLANLPPDQYAKLAPNVIAIANRYNPSYQIKPDLDQNSAKMLMMSNVPTEQMPMFDLMMGQSNLVNGLTNGGAGSGIIPNVTNVMPTGGGGFAAVNVPIGQHGGAAPIPAAEGGAQPIQGTGDLGAPSLPALPTDSLMTNPGLAVMKPQSVTAAADVKKTQYESPQGKEATAAGTALGGAKVEALKGAQEGQSNADLINQNTQQMVNVAQGLLKDHPYLANSTIGLNAGAYGQALNPFNDTKDIDTRLTSLKTFGAENLLPSIKAFLKGTGQVRVFEGTQLDQVFSYDPNHSLQANINKWEWANRQVQLGQQGAENLRKALQTGQLYNLNPNAPGIPPAPNAASQANSALQPKIGGKPSKLVANQTLYKGHLYIGGDPSQPSSWKAVGNGQ